MLNVVMLAGIVEAVQPARQYSTPIRLKVWDFARDGRRFDNTIFIDIPNEKAGLAVVGKYLSVRGKYQRRSYEKNGQKVWVNDIRVFEVSGDAPGEDHAPTNGSHAAPPARTNAPPRAPQNNPAPVQSSAGYPSDDDIPF